MADCRLQTGRLQAGRVQIGRVRIGALALAVLVVAACSVRPERSVLDQFFAAARLRDNTALRTLSTITFEPLERGIIVDFEIIGVSTEGADRKTVTITAPVRLRDGQIAQKTLVLTLERGALRTDAESARRWIVTAIAEIPVAGRLEGPLQTK